MKNLKKVLALVLALATVMGLGVTASAKEYTDSNSIEYTEAVDVMSAIGVLSGNPDGSFNPQGNLTRVQAAKMVSYLLNGGKDVNDLYAGSCQFTDCYSNWGKGYIAYANQMGIVSGVGNGKFNPNGTLTGVQLAKMMLTSLGYDADIEGYQNNNNWQVNIINDAQSAGLLKGLDDVNLYNAITREQASQMMFNALKATMVRYENRGSEIDLGNGVVIRPDGGDAKEVAQGSYANNMGENKDDSSKQTLQLAEKYFGGKKGLAPATTESDDFGRPAHEWMYDGKSAGVFADEADVTYTEAVELGDVYKDLGKVKDEAAVAYTDGDSNSRVVKVTSGNTDKIGGQGTLTQVYVNDEDKVTIVEINTYTGTINKFVKATEDKDAYVTISKENGDGALSESGKFETNAFTKDNEGDRILYTKADGVVKSVVPAESIDGAVTKYAKDSVTIDGTTYSAAATAKGLPTGDFSDFDSTFTFYMDTYGNVIYSELKQAAASKDYAYVLNVEETSGLSSGTGVKAQIILADGTKTIVDIDTYTSNGKTCYTMPKTDGSVVKNAEVDKNSTGAPDGDYANGNWFSYTVNADKEYTFNTVTKGYAEVENGLTLTKDKAATIEVAGDSYKAYTNANTVVTVTDKNDKVSTATGLVGAELTGKVLVTYGKNAKTIDAIYAVNQAKGLTTADATYAYAVKADGATKDGTDWIFAVDGKNVTYTVEKGVTVEKGHIYDLTLSDNKVTAVSEDAANTKNGTVEFADANTVVVKGDKTYTTGSKFAVYNVDADLASGDVGMTDTLEEGDKIAYVIDDDTILVAFIIAEAE